MADDAPEHKRLADAEDFREVIARSGAELVLHGHDHRFRFSELRGPRGPVPVFGVPSASLFPRNVSAAAGQYHLHRIEQRGECWEIEHAIVLIELISGTSLRVGGSSSSLINCLGWKLQPPSTAPTMAVSKACQVLSPRSGPCPQPAYDTSREAPRGLPLAGRSRTGLGQADEVGGGKGEGDARDPLTRRGLPPQPGIAPNSSDNRLFSELYKICS